MKSIRNRNITRNNHGIVALEFAFILPILALLLFAVIEFGWYFIRYEALSRALSVTSESAVTTGGAITQTGANGTGSGIVMLGTGGNYICAQAYQNNTNATNANPTCANGIWALGGATVTCVDTGVNCTTPYYVGIVAHATSASLTGLVSSILPQGTSITQSIIFPVGGATSGGSSGLHNIAVFTASGNWSAPAGITVVDVKVWGAGGGGGSADNAAGGGAGGGAGGFAESYVAVTPGNSYAVTVGAGGTGGTVNHNDATAGTASNFEGSVIGNGGALGVNDGNATVASTLGGTATGTIAMTGGMGGTGGNFSGGSGSGYGGSSPQGGQGGIARNNNSTHGYGDPGVLPGGGGGGGNGTSPGGVGAGGEVIISY